MRRSYHQIPLRNERSVNCYRNHSALALQGGTRFPSPGHGPTDALDRFATVCGNAAFPYRHTESLRAERARARRSTAPKWTSRP